MNPVSSRPPAFSTSSARRSRAAAADLAVDAGRRPGAGCSRSGSPRPPRVRTGRAAAGDPTGSARDHPPGLGVDELVARSAFRTDLRPLDEPGRWSSAPRTSATCPRRPGSSGTASRCANRSCDVSGPAGHPVAVVTSPPVPPDAVGVVARARPAARSVMAGYIRSRTSPVPVALVDQPRQQRRRRRPTRARPRGCGTSPGPVGRGATSVNSRRARPGVEDVVEPLGHQPGDVVVVGGQRARTAGRPPASRAARPAAGSRSGTSRKLARCEVRIAS